MQRAQRHRFTEPLILLLLAGVCYALFFYGLSGIGLIGPDEPRYASVAREMYVTGDYVTPRLQGAPWFEKPPLMYWGAALSYAIFGVGEFSSRFPSAFGSTLCVFFVYYVCLKIWGRAAAVSASLILATSVGYFAFARAASMDMPLTVCLTMALLSFLMAYNAGEPHRRWWFCLFYASVGLGVLAKGPVAFVLPALSLFGYLLFRGRLDEWREWHPRQAWIALAVAAPWYIAVTWVNGFEFIQVFFIDQNIARFTSTIHGHDRPFYFYIPDLLMLTFPWTFLLLPALKRSFERNDWILAWWAVVPVLFFSLSGSKLPGYILPSVPALVMLYAREVSNPSSRAFRIGVFIEAGAMVFIGVAFGFFDQMLKVDAHISGIVITYITFTLAVALVAIAIWLKPGLFAGFNVAVMILAVLVAVSFVLPRFETTDTMRPWREGLQGIVREDQTVFLYRPSRWMEYGMQFYRFNKTQGIFTPEEFVKAVQASPRTLFIAGDQSLGELSQIPNVEVEIVRTIGDQSAFWASPAR